MALTIIPATAPRTVDRLIVTIYGATGVGKTTLAMSAHQPVLLDCEEGEDRAIGTANTVRVRKWDDVASITAADIQPYSTVIIDTVGAMLQLLFTYLLEGDRKLGTRAGAPTIQGWMALSAAFRLWLRRLRQHKCDIILLAHEKEEQQGEDVKLRPDIVGQSRQEIYAVSHIIGLLMMNDRNQRILDCRPMFRHHGKNPPQWDAMHIADWTHDAPQPTMANLLADAKAKMSRPGTSAPAPAATVDTPAVPSVDVINAELAELLARQASKRERGMLWRKAQSFGYEYDPAAAGFVASS